MKVLITGGAGFIGSSLALFLDSLGYDVVVLDKKDNNDSGIFSIKGDINDDDACLKAMQGVDVVVHLAARARIPKSFEIPLAYFSDNVDGTMNVARMAIKCGVRRIIYAGSSTYYGDVEEDIPMTEDMEGKPCNWYGASKQMGEEIIQNYPDIPEYIIARFFTVYGEGQPLEDGEALVTGKFITSMLNNEPLTIHGDGEQTRDFVHVTDVCRALQKMIETENVNEVYNVGSGEKISINKLAKLFTSDIIYVKQPNGYARHTLADISKSNKKLGWMPVVNIKDGINRLIQNL